MAKNKSTSGRIKLKDSLARAVAIVASDKSKDTTKKPAKDIFTVDRGAAKILMLIASLNPNLGWQVLYALDAMLIYGSQIVLLYEGLCSSDQATFIDRVVKRDPQVTSWLDQQRILYYDDRDSQNPMHRRS